MIRKRWLGITLGLLVIAFGVYDIIDNSASWGISIIGAGLYGLTFFYWIDQRARKKR